MSRQQPAVPLKGPIDRGPAIEIPEFFAGSGFESPDEGSISSESGFWYPELRRPEWRFYCCHDLIQYGRGHAETPHKGRLDAIKGLPKAPELLVEAVELKESPKCRHRSIAGGRFCPTHMIRDSGPRFKADGTQRAKFNETVKDCWHRYGLWIFFGCPNSDAVAHQPLKVLYHRMDNFYGHPNPKQRKRAFDMLLAHYMTESLRYAVSVMKNAPVDDGDET